jgi:aspartate dehydrogenase
MMTIKKIGIAGIGAIGKTVADALVSGIDGYKLSAISDIIPHPEYGLPQVSLEALPDHCDLVIECLPPSCVPSLAKSTLMAGKDIIIISSCALLIHSEILEWHKQSTSRIIVPSGALIGLDGVSALKEMGILNAKIVSTKHPKGFSTAPFVEKNKIDLGRISTPTCLFSGNAMEAAAGFPANVNVAATLSLAGIGPEKTQVEIWADPQTQFNSHEIVVESAFSRITAKVQNAPDPTNPKTSVLAARSIIAVLRGFTEPLAVL